MSGRYLVVEEAAVLLACSVDTVQRKAARGEIPHRKLAGMRRILFVEDELVAWVDGAELEVVESRNARIVRPVENGQR